MKTKTASQLLSEVARDDKAKRKVNWAKITARVDAEISREVKNIK